jgi:membrane fusion protein, multidrug efflux system
MTKPTPNACLPTHVLCLLCACSVLPLAFAGCQRGPQTGPQAEPPVIPVSHPVYREVTDYVDYTGRTDAVESVGVRARVTGYLTKLPFKEGAEVKKGDLLFEIDPRPYQAMVDQAQSQVKLAETQLNLAKITYERDQRIAEESPRAISAQQLDQDKAAVDSAQAQIKAAQAVLDAYKLNLSFCQVTSPIDGQVSRYYYTLGNLVTQDQTLLTTVVSVDPIYAYYDVDEPTLLRVRRAINEGKIKPRPGANGFPVLMALQGETGYPHEGTINFVNNAINPSTGTLAVRGVFPNSMPENGVRLLAPGMFVRIRVPIGQPHPALLVIDRAVGSDQGLKFVYVVGPDNKVEYRRVTTGALQPDGLRVIEDGLKPDDRVVVGGIQQVRPRMQIEVEEQPMPTLEGDDSAAAPAAKRPMPPPRDSAKPGNDGGKPPPNPRPGAGEGRGAGRDRP